ncbi:MAG TPA: acyl-CoA dehydrogenase family protein [Polyangiales bacterium]|nr:acyl-CoA dehydrogenase family protein [Polyangiales bacterium]
MLLQLSSDQEFFQKTTARYLEDNASVAELRRRREDAEGFKERYWRQGAELGWTSLLVSEEDGGVSISGRGLVDLTLVAYEFGRHAAPGPLAATNVVAGALSAAGAGDHKALIAGLLDGSALVAWCIGEGAPDVEIAVQGDELVLNGVKRSVESADRASHLLVTGRTGGGLSQVIVAANAKGLSITPMRGIDLSRRFSLVKLEDVRVPLAAAVGELGKADAAVEQQIQNALVLHSAEALGAMQASFDMTVEWAFDRYSFGRPLASYQALKHRFAHMATWLQASHAICDEAARAVDEGRADAAELVSAAKAYVGQHGAELIQDCVQLHGGIGVTFEHDLHLFLRRLTLIRTLLGTPDAHLRRLAGLVAKQVESKEAARGE